MTNANGEFVKVYLYLLYCMNTQSSECSISAMADHFNHTENDILRALKFWEKAGVLRLEYNDANEICQIALVDLSGVSVAQPAVSSESVASPVKKAATNVKKETATQSSNQTVAPINATVSTPPIATTINTSTVTEPAKKEYSLNEIQKFSEDPDIAELLFIMESYLKHPLTPTDMNTVFYWIDSLRFSKDLAEYLVEYCIGGGHSSLRYMDKVALGWSEEGITTVEQAKNQGSNRSKACYGVMKALGITGRNLIEPEVEFVNKWTKDYGFEMSLIEEACKRTILKIQQPNFEYTDKILTDWYNHKVHSLKDVDALDASFSKNKKAASTARNVNNAKNNRFNNFNQRSYDFEALEKDLLTSSAQ